MARFESSMKNLAVAWGGQLVSVLLAFVARGVFAQQLSMEYMGLENLFSNVLTILSLADLGVGSAVVFSLYEPLAKNDTEKVKSLMRFFKRAYITIGIVIAAIGFGLAPFIDVLIAGAPDIPNLSVYFLCFVLNTAVSYFFSYKGSLIYADQKNYIVSLFQYSFQIIMCIAQIAVLFLTHNYLLFLLCMIASTVLQNVGIAHKANMMFPYLKDKNVEPLDKGTLSLIIKNTFALVLHKIAGIASVPASSLIISKFAGINAIAIYGNYMLIINSLSRILDKTFDAVTASVGNLGAQESGERQYEVFKISFFINAFLYTVVCSVLFCCFNPLVFLWLGEDYLFPTLTVCLLTIWLYVKGMRSAEQSFTSAYGLYWFSWYKAVVETISLLGLSLALVQVAGIDGVILSGVVSLLLIATTMEVWVLYKHGFKRSPKDYFIKLGIYSLLTLILTSLSYCACMLIPGSGVISLLLKGVVSLTIAMGGFCLVFRKSHEFSEFVILLHRACSLVKRKR